MHTTKFFLRSKLFLLRSKTFFWTARANMHTPSLSHSGESNNNHEINVMS